MVWLRCSNLAELQLAGHGCTFRMVPELLYQSEELKILSSVFRVKACQWQSVVAFASKLQAGLTRLRIATGQEIGDACMHCANKSPQVVPSKDSSEHKSTFT